MRNRLPALGVLVVALVVLVGINKDALLEFAQARAEKMSRVDNARVRLKTSLPALYAEKKVVWPPIETFLRAIKQNDDGTPGVVELWARSRDQAQLTLIQSYPICAMSGISGPKRRQGDLQIPEGFYTIEKLNSQSSYHLSLRVDYPNASDKIRGRQAGGNGVDLGGDIMVHGECVTIGCIPIENAPIEEVYLSLDQTFPKVPTRIHIFPRRLDDAGLQALLSTTTDATLQAFWRELSVGYQRFEATKQVPSITVAKDGVYVVK